RVVALPCIILQVDFGGLDTIPAPLDAGEQLVSVGDVFLPRRHRIDDLLGGQFDVGLGVVRVQEIVTTVAVKPDCKKLAEAIEAALAHHRGVALRVEARSGARVVLEGSIAERANVTLNELIKLAIDAAALLARQPARGEAVHSHPRSERPNCNSGFLIVALRSSSPPAGELARGSRTRLSGSGRDALRWRTHTPTERDWGVGCLLGRPGRRRSGVRPCWRVVRVGGLRGGSSFCFTVGALSSAAAASERDRTGGPSLDSIHASRSSS